MSFVRGVAMTAAIGGYFALCASTSAAIIGVQWKNAGPDTWELYAEMESGFRLTNADLGDDVLNEAPAGVNHGLFVSNGTMESVSLFMGASVGFDARPSTLTPFAGGQLLDAAWFTIGGVFGSTVEGTTGGTILGVKILTVQISPGAVLGGIGPDGETPSRIFLFANDGTASGTHFGVYDIPPIPSPGGAAVALCSFGLFGRRRSR